MPKFLVRVKKTYTYYGEIEIEEDTAYQAYRAIRNNINRNENPLRVDDPAIVWNPTPDTKHGVKFEATGDCREIRQETKP